MAIPRSHRTTRLAIADAGVATLGILLAFEPDELLTFCQRHFVPYHGGYTLLFAERPMYLQEDQNRDLIDGFAERVEPCAHDPRPATVAPDEHAALNAVLAALPTTVSDAVVDDIAARHGARVAACARRITDDLVATPVDWRTATVDDGLLAMSHRIDERYPWMDGDARRRLVHLFAMAWK